VRDAGLIDALIRYNNTVILSEAQKDLTARLSTVCRRREWKKKKSSR